ncbi:GreA/GreB family elongation factor [Meiothermus taiwanensis]|jgi:transcription elongation factor GreA|uniref:Transcription inhibitor protein Gfh1 n=2 Tax=Meiothermus taiwanensis TaxID=172827 RepID=A0A399E335_9DEIN|nr:GreA/GreB family elongation factor [Meiothermus taiwanensis]AWR86719.1 GreA/GreB family elongation factor [Meiothermus taiwanensis WR-220]KIQ54918.1 transcription elongation factor GreA [Meiothermus taiwanensis]KZK16838.1 transcription elongation factor GreA [Meiothermus taiwanensis]RIH77040.1 Transcription inhibitor protein Gfh1 [Meiothermus taiwanensis]
MAREVKLTKSGYERLVAELEQERARLQDATRILQELMESSDDYDDSGLEDAKREKARIEARIDSLTDTLSRAQIMEEEGTKVSQVTLGAIVTLRSKEGEIMEVQVVAPAEASVLERPMKISDESPMGRALLGQKVGARVLLETPKGKKEFKIESIQH